jgi:c(7)-type cytochrome triheme protein
MRRGIVLLMALLPAVAQAEQVGGKRRRALPHEFGRVVLSERSPPAGLAPVVFEHWLHRAKYTCRVCHVDVGFAMRAGGTGIRAADNAGGYFCGACHDGRTTSEGRRIFESCAPGAARAPGPTCLRCHSLGRGVKPQPEFAELTRGLPRGRFGNGVDWEEAEDLGRIRPVDFLEGVSIPRKPLADQKDFALSPTLPGMPEIIFSHAKHTVWNGCELCHPDIFGAVKRGAVKYAMGEIFEGRYCGACHVSVAFPLQDCQRCHARPVQ